MDRVRIGFVSSLLIGAILLTTAISNAAAAPLFAATLVEGRTYDQAHDSGYIDWSGPVQYVYLTHRDATWLPPEEGGTFCTPSCTEWVTRLSNGGVASGTFDRNVAYFEALVGFSPDPSVGNATLRACSSVKTWPLTAGGTLPGFVTMDLPVPSGCRSWSLSASGGYVDFRSIDVNYISPPSTPTNTSTPLPSVTPSQTSTPTLIPTSTLTLTPTYTPTFTPTFTPTNTPSPTATNTPSPTPTPLPPQINGQVVCDLWGDAGWCRGNESLELTATDPQGFAVTISGDLNGVPFSCGSSCTVDLPEVLGIANYTAISASGRTATGTSTWQRDVTPPILNIVAPSVDGQNGWYVSEVDIRVNASDAISGLDSVAGRVGDGATWSSFPVHISDGVFSVAARALDVAGNEAIVTEVLRVDTTAPVSQITSHLDGDLARGNILITGKLDDETSGPATGELSVDRGTTWQAVLMGTAETWSFTWNSTVIANGQYQVQVRGTDQAGNQAEPVSIGLIVDNGPPLVTIAKHWWIWESGKLEVSPNHFPIASAKVIISDPKSRWPELVLDFDPHRIPAAVSWNRHFADDMLAPSGWYRVIAIACDVHSLCSSDEGIVEIPPVATSTATLTPSPIATVTMTPQATLAATQTQGTPTLIFGAPYPTPIRVSTQATRSIPFWQLLGLLGLFLAIASASVIDPRPVALDRLRGSIKLISGQNILETLQGELEIESKGPEKWK